MGLKQIIADKTKSCVVATPRQRNVQLLDDLEQNTHNTLCNNSATTGLKALVNKDFTRNRQRNHDATIQKKDTQLLPQKMSQKLHSKNEELRNDLPTLSAYIDGDNSVILANILKSEAAKPHYENIVVSEASTNDENLSHPQIEDGQHSQYVEVTHLEFKERYAHMVKCQQCEHLSSTGQCTRKQGIKPIPDALRTCDKFNLLKGERGLIQGQNYTPSEINSLIERYEKPLFYHALDCSICHIQKAQYCANGYAIGSVYDALLLVCEDAQARREDLALRIDRACISGRSVFESFNPANVQHTPNAEPTTEKYGHSAEYEAFINHWTACEVCKPNLARYCIEGQQLKEVADNSNVAF